jgi:hypothetical protein
VTSPSAVPVVTGLPRYAAAVAELAPRVRLVRERRGAVVVVDGTRRWWLDAAEAASAGAVGVVVAQPRLAPPADALEDVRIPLVIARRLLRADVGADAGPDRAPRLIVADADGPAHGLATWLRDVVGWCRVLAGGPARIDRAARSAGALLAAGSTPAGVPVSITVTTRDVGAAAACALVGIGAERTEVSWDEAAGSVDVARIDVDGRHTAVPSREGAERLALRRALGAVVAGSAPDDLRDLRDDARTVEDMLRIAGS